MLPPLYDHPTIPWDAGAHLDPMDVDQATAAAAAAATAAPGATAGEGPSGGVARQPAPKPMRLGPQGLADVNPDILDLTVEDEGLESMRRSLLELVTAKLSQVPVQHAPAFRALSAGCLQDMFANELNRRAALYSSRLGKQSDRANRQTDTCQDSPAKIKQASRVLNEPSPEAGQAFTQYTGLFDKAADQAQGADVSAAEYNLKMDTLLIHHSKSKKSRANRWDFGTHCGQARDKVTSAINTATQRKDYELAYKLTDALRDHEGQLQSFLIVCDKVGFSAAKNAYVSRADPISGLSKESWDLAASMAAAGEHKKLFQSVLAGVVSPGKKKRHAEGEANASSDSGNDSDPPVAAPQRKRRPSRPVAPIPPADPVPFCQFCGQDHWQSECLKFRAAMQHGMFRGDGNGSGFNRRGGGGGGGRGRGAGRQYPAA